MNVSRALFVVFKTSGGKAWNPSGYLKPLSPTQKQNRRKNIEQTLKNNSVLKMAAAHEPEVPTRLYKPLPNFRLAWMKKKLEQAEGVIKGSVAGQQPSGGAGSMHHMLPPGRPQAPYALRVRALAAQLAGLSSAQATAGGGGSSTAGAGAQQE